MKINETLNRLTDTGLIAVERCGCSAEANAKALLEGGVDAVEVRSGDFAAIICALKEACPEMIVGAGDLRSADDCRSALTAGADYISTCGLDAEVAAACAEAEVLYIPSCATAGEVYTAAYNVGQKIDGLAMLPIQSIAAAATAFVGQNMGAQKLQRVKEGTRATVIMVFIWCVIVNLLILPVRVYLCDIFTENPAVAVAGGRYILCLLPFYPVFGTMFCLNSIMRGAGESIVPMLIAFAAQIFFRVPGVYLLAHFFGPDYMYFGFGLGWFAGAVMASLYYASGRWKRHGSLAAKKA